MPSSKNSPGLRKRQLYPDAEDEKSSKASAAPLTYHSLSTTGHYFMVFASVIVSTYLFLRYYPTHDSLPTSYALCSREGAKIYTVDSTVPNVQCIVVHNSNFVDVGPLEEVRRRWSATSRNSTALRALPIRYIEPGAIVVPGITDSHAHILEYGFTKLLPMEGTSTVQETVARVRDYIQTHPDILNDKSKLVEGWGWDQTKWLKSNWPTTDDLEADPVVAGRPIILQSKDGHALWVSRKIMTAMEPIPDEVEGGIIIRDPFGKPAGASPPFHFISGELT
ncbi:hypothetical protein PHLCEN_2v11950 [Hermanssonia centrifuga]|uniref:Amidohydrolase 3 domain-containing protein n=1 Tax=Hermanssonia centrifuga TaxID=98765 RepID=A0A2R6NIS6_9APHY|nr:hypothetical protein PHLCEN_2v11950 [Hermanssonia centrifuga]